MSKNQRRSPAKTRTRSATTGRYASKSAAVDAYLRRLQSMGPDKVLSKRIEDVSKGQRRPA
jgi:hypothetical protein